VTVVRLRQGVGTSRGDKKPLFSLFSRESTCRGVDLTRMNTRTHLACLTIGLATLTGCANDAGNGALIGGGVGALAGGIIGHQSGHTAGGALIGGAIGAGTGALIGHASDENKIKQQKEYDRGYEDARGDASYRSSPQPSSGYYSSSETTRTSVGSGGYRSSRTTTETSSTSTTYYR
jgi:hypothetical protein